MSRSRRYHSVMFAAAVGCTVFSSIQRASPQSGSPIPAEQSQRNGSLWSPPVSANRTSHFEKRNGRSGWFVDGLPFTALGAETEWDRILYPRYQQTMGVYDYTYPAAAAMHLDMMKVPVKWSQVEPQEGKYDFSYVDHIKVMAEQFHLKIALDWFGHYASGPGTIYSDRSGSMYAPLWVINNSARFPRAVDADGSVHDDAASYDTPAIIEVEAAAFAALMSHIRQVDAETHTFIGIQVENEIAVFGGTDRRNPKLWRDHSAASNREYAEHGFTDDLRYTSWDYSTTWLRAVTDAGAAAYTLPFFMNFVGGNLEDWMVGGSPGEDVGTYLANLPNLTFIGLNNYVSDPDDYSADNFRATLSRYRVGRNLPSITETNSGRSPVAERSLFLALGEFGAPLFTPWSLIVSYPARQEPYVMPDGELANGAFALSAAYEVLNEALPAISYWGGTEHAKVFLADFPNTRFSKTEALGSVEVTVGGDDNGQAIVLAPSDHELILIGYRCQVTLNSSSPTWPARDHMDIETGKWIVGRWARDGEPEVFSAANGQPGTVRIFLPEPRVVRVSWQDSGETQCGRFSSHVLSTLPRGIIQSLSLLRLSMGGSAVLGCMRAPWCGPDDTQTDTRFALGLRWLEHPSK